MDYQEAKELADRRQADLAPYCERIEIAGSVRRLKQTDIKDVEIVCVAKTEAIKDMFGIETGKVSLIENIFPELLKSWSAITLRNGTKWKTCVFPGGGKLDLFIVTTDTWGTNLAIKTGPADYSKWLVTKKREGGAFPSHANFSGNGGFEIVVHGKVMPMQEEIDFFNFLGIPMLEPKDRKI